MKKIIHLLTLSIILSIITLPSVFALENKCDIYDYSEVLSSTEENKLQELGQKYADKYNIDIVFLTTNNTNGKSSMTYSDDFYDGIEGPIMYADDGILFFIDLDNNMNYVNTVGSAIIEITDIEIEKILDAAAEADLTDFYGCFENMLLESMKCYKYGTLVSFVIADVFPVSLPIIFISIFVVFFLSGILIVKHNAANAKINAIRYVDKNNLKINVGTKRFIKTFDKVQRGYYSSGSGSGGSSSHRSSSGRSHGGGGRRR